MLFLLLSLLASQTGSTAFAQNTDSQSPVKHVIVLSIDGLRSDAIRILGPQGAATFHQIMKNGASTLNARTDPNSTVTLPNHTTMLTGHPVKGKNGHNYVHNRIIRQNIHEVSGRFISSAFDVVHERGLRTAFFASKPKFGIFVVSYAAHLLKKDILRTIKGSSSIDIFQTSYNNDNATLDVFLREFLNNRPTLSFLHFCGPDNVGHVFNWDIRPNSVYLNEVQRKDRLVGTLLKVIQNHPVLSKTTVVIITADHGGQGNTHGDVRLANEYTIPFFVWGRDVANGVDLYALNADVRRDPDKRQINYSAEEQPIRVGDIANLALSLLGLPPVPGSTINARQDLKVSSQSLSAE